MACGLKIDRIFHLLFFRRWRRSEMDWNRRPDEFSEFYDQILAQRKENMTKCSHKTEREFQLMWRKPIKKFSIIPTFLVKPRLVRRFITLNIVCIMGRTNLFREKWIANFENVCISSCICCGVVICDKYERKSLNPFSSASRLKQYRLVRHAKHISYLHFQKIHFLLYLLVHWYFCMA